MTYLAAVLSVRCLLMVVDLYKLEYPTNSAAPSLSSVLMADTENGELNQNLKPIKD